MAYADLLKDPRWQRKRLEKMQEADWKCSLCHGGTKTLNVHHKKYRRGAMPWEYELGELEVLCDDCHGGVHDARNTLADVISELGMYDLRRLLGYAQCVLAGRRSMAGIVTEIVAEDPDVARGVSDWIGDLAFGEAEHKGGVDDVMGVAEKNGGKIDPIGTQDKWLRWCSDGWTRFFAEQRKGGK